MTASLASAQISLAPSRLIVVDPGHFHAALLQKEMYPGLADHVAVYAPLGPDLLDYLNRISLFNSRKDKPTHWELEIHCSPDPMEEMLRDRPGTVVVLAGRNRGKMDRILASLEANLNVLADKPWIISSSDLPKLDRALGLAGEKGLVAYDIMTERYEATSILQRVLVNDHDVFGRLEQGSADQPAVSARSVHNVMKVVAGVTLRRPAWFFDIAEYGEGLADVGTHVVDLVQWTAFPDQSIDYKKDIQILDGRRWPLTLTKGQFQQITGDAEFPPSLASQIHDGKLNYFCNNSVHYTLRGSHVKLDILWNWEAAPGTGDAYEASFRGTKARVEIRQGQAERYSPELYVVPVDADMRAEVFDALKRRIAGLQREFAGLAVEERGDEARVVIPAKYRVGHEEHFAQVANRFFEYLKSPRSIPAWERPNMLAKYYVTTMGVEIAKTK